MHRKSAYFLFLAVLGMLVIGIVMLFSTSAFARDSHGDMYFFVKRQAVWLGVGFVVCAVAAAPHVGSVALEAVHDEVRAGERRVLVGLVAMDGGRRDHMAHGALGEDTPERVGCRGRQASRGCDGSPGRR